MTPSVSLNYASISFDDYQKTGGAQTLTVSSDSYSACNLGGWVMLSRKGKTISPEFGAMLYYDLIGDTIRTTSRFIGGSTYFQTRGADPARTTWELTAALNFESPATPITVKIGYDLLGREDFLSHNFSGKLNLDF